MRTRRVLFQKITAFDIHPTWRGVAPREHFLEFLAFGEFRHGFIPLLLPVEFNTLLVDSTHLGSLWGQLPLVGHDLHGLYGLELAHHLDFVDRTPCKVIRPCQL